MPSLDSFALALQRWQDFYMLAGGAAATLTGLMFVAVTFGSSLVRKETVHVARAFLDPTFMHFAQVVIMGLVMNVPTLSAGVLGAMLIALGGGRMVTLAWVFKQYLQVQRVSGDMGLSDWLGGVAAPALCHFLTVLVGVGFRAGYTESFSALAVVTIGILVTGLYCAWEQMVWMAATVEERRAGPGVSDGRPPS